MKKVFALLLSLALVCGLMACGCGDTEETTAGPVKDPAAAADSIKVLATIVIDGEIQRSYEKVDCKDLDGDGFVDVLEVLEQLNSAFFVIHEGETVKDYFNYEKTDDMVTVTKFYNKETSAFAFFVNDEPVNNLYDAVFDGSRINVFNYTDTTNYSDTYTFFKEVSVEGDNHTLQLLGYKYDENGNFVQFPIAGAQIEYEDPKEEDGEIEIYETDSDGIVTFDYGEYMVVLSATSSELNIVTPVFYSKLPD